MEGSETSQNHVCSAYGQVVRPGDDKRPVVIVAHSYGAAAVSYLFKARPEARARVKAVAFTDGCALCGTIFKEELPDEAAQPALHAKLAKIKEKAPEAFEADAAAAAALKKVARNFVASDRPLGEAVPGGDLDQVSAGHTSHPATTAAATDAVFAFLAERLAA